MPHVLQLYLSSEECTVEWDFRKLLDLVREYEKLIEITTVCYYQVTVYSFKRNIAQLKHTSFRNLHACWRDIDHVSLG